MPIIVTVIIPVLIALVIQAYMMFQLTGQVSQLSEKLSQSNPAASNWESPTFQF